MAPRQRPAGTGRNERTAQAVVMPASRAFEEIVQDAGPAWAVASQELERRRQQAGMPAASAVFATTDGSTVLSALALQGTALPEALILGNHTQCDIDGLPDACLRHVLLLLWPEGSIEVIDLRTGMGFGLDNRRATQATAPRALQFNVGSAEIVVVSANQGELLPRTSAEVLTQLAASRDAIQVQVEPRFDAPQRSNPVHVSALANRFGKTLVGNVVVGSPVSRPDDELVMRTTLAELNQGLLIGRYPRCQMSRFHAGDANVSRVHAGLFHRKDTLFLVDLGSTNGTSVRAANGRIRAELGHGERVARLERDERVVISHHDVSIVVE